MNEFELVGEARTDLGKRETRRLRRSGRVPAILYGGESAPVPFALNANEVKKHLENEAFSSHILNVKIGASQTQAVLKDVQRDPVSSVVSHMDLQRVSATKELQMNVPLHFMNEETCPGVKAGGIVTHLEVEVEIRCLPKDLPEYLEVDLANIDIGDTVHLSELKVPPGVELVDLMHGEEFDSALVSVQMPRVIEEEEEAEAEEAEEGVELGEEITKLVEAGEEEPKES